LRVRDSYIRRPPPAFDVDRARHEIVAEVAIVGEAVSTDSAGAPLSVGDLVSVSYLQTCRHCVACAQGKFEFCQHKLDHWLRSPSEPPHFIGTMATHYYVSRNQTILKLPPNVSALMAVSANCALVQVVHALEKADLRPGQNVVIQGAGGLGLYLTALCKERGAAVLVIDGAENRLCQAIEFGANFTVSMEQFPSVAERASRVEEILGKDNVHAVFDVSGSPAAFPEGVGLVSPGGRMIEVGIVLPGVDVTFDLGTVARRGVSVHTVVHYQPRHLKDALDFLSRNAETLPLESLIDQTFPLDQIDVAISRMADRSITRAAITPAGFRVALQPSS